MQREHSKGRRRSSGNWWNSEVLNISPQQIDRCNLHQLTQNYSHATKKNKSGNKNWIHVHILFFDRLSSAIDQFTAIHSHHNKLVASVTTSQYAGKRPHYHKIVVRTSLHVRLHKHGVWLHRNSSSLLLTKWMEATTFLQRQSLETHTAKQSDPAMEAE